MNNFKEVEMFFGRKAELKKLDELLDKTTASLIVVKGRRRIGKSTLIQKFAEKFDLFCEIQGVAPRDGITDDDQRENFSEQLKDIFDIPAFKLDNWTDAFSVLARFTQTGRVLILLDEISWMGGRNKEFVGKLKIAWDTKFKKNDKLVLVLCGSVSAWIEKNILNDTDFVGRISYEMDLEGLPLSDCNKFWQAGGNRISAKEKLNLLAVTGGVPKYLEEINVKRSAEQNIQRMCFDKGGILFNEFDKIFNDIFNKRAAVYKKIVEVLSKGSRTTKEIAQLTGRPLNGDISEYLNDLELSGFIKRDFIYTLYGKKSRLSKYRIKDNYLRFYLKYIEPVKDNVEHGLFQFKSIETMSNWSIIMGLQFENLVLENLNCLIEQIGLDVNSIISAAPYFQNATSRNKGRCRIDLLIHTSFETFYLCEIKFRKKIDKSIVKEVQKKIDILKRPMNSSIRPVLIHGGEIGSTVENAMFFDKIIPFEALLEE